MNPDSHRVHTAVGFLSCSLLLAKTTFIWMNSHLVHSAGLPVPGNVNFKQPGPEQLAGGTGGASAALVCLPRWQHLDQLTPSIQHVGLAAAAAPADDSDWRIKIGRRRLGKSHPAVSHLSFSESSSVIRSQANNADNYSADVLVYFCKSLLNPKSFNRLSGWRCWEVVAALLKGDFVNVIV